jgi:SepF-like predicted cell division protein (DUF552 family)
MSNDNFGWSLLIAGDRLADLERASSVSSNMTTISSAEINSIIDLFEISSENKSINTIPPDLSEISSKNKSINTIPPLKSDFKQDVEERYK